MQEKILLLEERYLLAAKDYAGAEILAIVDALDGPVSYKDISERMLMPQSERTVSRALKSFEDQGVISRDRSRGGYVYTVRKDTMWEIMKAHGLNTTEHPGVTIRIPNIAKVVNNPEKHTLKTEGEDLSAILESTRREPVTRQSVLSRKIETGQVVPSQNSKKPFGVVPFENRTGIEPSEVIHRTSTPETFVFPVSMDLKTGQIVVSSTPETGQVVRSEENRPKNQGDSEKESEIIKNNNKEKDTYDSVYITTPYSTGNNTALEPTETSPYKRSINGDSEAVSYSAHEKSKPPAKKKSKGKKYYDWKHYDQIPQEAWSKAKDSGEFPEGESAVTLIIGAYLLAVKKKRGIEFGLVPQDFGKYTKLAKNLLDFMTARAGGDELQGFRDALGWMHEFADCDETTFIGKSSWSIQLAFSRDVYRQVGTLRPSLGTRPGDRPKTGVNVIWTSAEREFRAALHSTFLWEWLHMNAKDNPKATEEMAQLMREIQQDLIFVLKGRFGWDDQRIENDRKLRQAEAHNWIDPDHFGFFLDENEWGHLWVVTPEDAERYTAEHIWNSLEERDDLPRGGRYTPETKEAIDARLFGNR